MPFCTEFRCGARGSSEIVKIKAYQSSSCVAAAEAYEGEERPLRLAALEARVASFGGAHDSGGGSGGGMSTGVVAAIAVGAIVGIGAIGVLLWRARCAGSTARCPSDPDGSDGDAGKGGKAPMRDDQALQSL